MTDKATEFAKMVNKVRSRVGGDDLHEYAKRATALTKQAEIDINALLRAAWESPEIRGALLGAGGGALGTAALGGLTGTGSLGKNLLYGGLAGGLGGAGIGHLMGAANSPGFQVPSQFGGGMLPWENIAHANQIDNQVQPNQIMELLRGKSGLAAGAAAGAGGTYGLTKLPAFPLTRGVNPATGKAWSKWTTPTGQFHDPNGPQGWLARAMNPRAGKGPYKLPRFGPAKVYAKGGLLGGAAASLAGGVSSFNRSRDLKNTLDQLRSTQ